MAIPITSRSTLRSTVHKSVLLIVIRAGHVSVHQYCLESHYHWKTAVPVTKLRTLGAAMYYLLSSDYEELE